MVAVRGHCGMITLDVPPKLILPERYQANRPAIICSVGDLASYFPVDIDQKTQQAIVTKLTKLGFIDDRAKASKLIEAAIPFGVFKPSSRVLVEFTDSAITSADTTSYSFTNIAIGSGERYVIVCVGHASTRDTSTVSVAGSSCTQVYDPGSTSLLLPSWWKVYLGSGVGTTGTVAVTGPSADSNGCFVGVWVVSPNWGGTIGASANNGSAAQTNPAITMTIPPNGWALTAARNPNNLDFTFTNSTLRFNENAGNNFRGGGSDYLNTGASASRTITANATNARHSGIVVA